MKNYFIEKNLYLLEYRGSVIDLSAKYSFLKSKMLGSNFGYANSNGLAFF